MPLGKAARTGVRRRIGQALFLVLAPLLMLELVVRVAGTRIRAVEVLLYSPTVASAYDQARSLPELLDATVLGFRPGTKYNDFVLNSRSFLTKEYAAAKPAGALRVLAFGNSFTIDCGGLPYQALWHYRLRQHLERATGRTVEILNLGVPAVGPEFELRLWELEGARLDADLVVVGFTVGTNFLASRKSQRERGFADRCAEWSCAYRLVRNALGLKAAMPEGGWQNDESAKQADARIPADARGVPMAEVVPGYEHAYDPERPAYSEDKFMQIQASYLRSCSTDREEERFGPAADTLAKFKQSVVAAGAEFLVLIIPSEVQSNRALRSEVIALPGPPDTEDEIQVDTPQRFLRERCEREGIRYLDLLPAFVRTDPSPPRYGKFDTHWNIAGNLFAERELYEYLMRPEPNGAPSLWDRLSASPPE